MSAVSAENTTHLSGRANDGGQRGLLEPIGGAGGGAQVLGGGGAQAAGPAQLGGVAAGVGGARGVHWVDGVGQLLVQFVLVVVDVGQGGGTVQAGP